MSSRLQAISRHWRLAVLVAAISLAGAGTAARPSAPEQNPAQPEPNPFAKLVRLSFGWPEHLNGKVAYRQTIVESNNGKRSETVIRGESTLVVAPESENLLRISGESLSVKVEGPDGPEDSDEGRKAFRDFVLRLSTLTPAYLVDRRGAFVDVTGINELHHTLKVALDDFSKSSAWNQMARAENITPDQRRKLVERMFSREQLRATMVAEWNRMVQQWLGAEMEIGSVYSLSGKSRVPMLGDISIPTVNRYAVAGRVACNAADTELHCVDLRMDSRLDPDKMREAMTRFLGQSGVTKSLPRVEVNVDYRLIAEPGTLLPYREAKVQTTRVTERAPDGSEKQTEQINTLSAEYTYEPQ